MAEIESGTIAAAVPIEVPTMRRVTGISATSRMMKGRGAEAVDHRAEDLVERAMGPDTARRRADQHETERQAEDKLMAPEAGGHHHGLLQGDKQGVPAGSIMSERRQPELRSDASRRSSA